MDSDPTAGIPTTAAPGQPAAIDVARAAMAAYAVPTPVDKATWYSRIAPYLSDETRRTYVYTDPINVRAHRLIGVPTVTRQTDYLATVTQGTDAGRYTVSLARGDDGSWQVYRIDPPAQAPAGS